MMISTVANTFPRNTKNPFAVILAHSFCYVNFVPIQALCSCVKNKYEEEIQQTSCLVDVCVAACGLSIRNEQVYYRLLYRDIPARMVLGGCEVHVLYH